MPLHVVLCLLRDWSPILIRRQTLQTALPTMEFLCRSKWSDVVLNAIIFDQSSEITPTARKGPVFQRDFVHLLSLLHGLAFMVGLSTLGHLTRSQISPQTLLRPSRAYHDRGFRMSDCLQRDMIKLSS